MLTDCGMALVLTGCERDLIIWHLDGRVSDYVLGLDVCTRLMGRKSAD